ncbi:DUF58 domain-containing protein [Motilimonas cestriensis]|uniref:DUF58 domain-containing protein n=1 Tax=Motilimonas cestriensis TaxID=2742685 RepID=UPI003DA64B37
MINPALPYSDGLNLTLKELLYYQQQKKSRASQGMAKSMLAGPYRSLIKGRGMEFDEVRHYQAGDDVRAIDWRVTARTGSTHTKVFKEEKERPVLLLVDFSDSMIFGSQLLLKSVQAAHLAAQLAWQAKQRGDRIGGVIFNQDQHQELRPKGRASGVLKLVHQLQNLHRNQPQALQNAPNQPESGERHIDPGQYFTEQLTRLRRLANTGSQIHIISDFAHLNDEGEKQLALIKRHNQVTAWQLHDPLEQSIPTGATASLNVVSEQGRGWLNLGKDNRRYQQQALLRQQSLELRLKRRAIGHRQVNAGQPLLQQMSI